MGQRGDSAENLCQPAIPEAHSSTPRSDSEDVTRLAQGHGVCHVAVLEPEPRSLPGLVTRALSPLPGVPALPVLALETVTARDAAGVRHGLHGSRKEARHSNGRVKGCAEWWHTTDLPRQIVHETA